jgi:RimJ/RimL family protein N-acetyltransferase
VSEEWHKAGEVYLETARMILRRFTREDVDLLVELDGDPDVMFWITGGRTTPREEVERDVLPAFLSWYEKSAGYGLWAAIERSTGSFLGWFHLRPGSDDGPTEAELGYRLRKDAWNQGFATEGSRALVDKAFRELGATRIYAETMTVNYASRRVMEKAGLLLVRTFHADWPDRIPGDEHGDVEYAITRHEWFAASPGQPPRDG